MYNVSKINYSHSLKVFFLLLSDHFQSTIPWTLARFVALVATGQPPISVTGDTYVLHNSRTGCVFIWKWYSTPIGIRLFQECFSPTSDHIDSFRSEYDAWDRDFDSSFVYEFEDMTFGCVVHLRGDGVIVDRNDPIQIGFGDDIFPPCVMRKIEDMWK